MKITDDFVFFWRGIYSNWHPCKFVDGISGIEFNNTEQAFMWWKADFFRDFGIRDKIATMSDPSAAKQAGRAITGYNDTAWNLMRFSFMSYVNYLKYSQNPDLSAQLLSTGNRLMVEASPYDKIWGIGMGEDEPGIEQSENWKGANIHGLVLTSVRLQLLLEKKSRK